MDIEVRKTSINKATLDDMLASFLYSISYVNDNEEISNIKLGKPSKKGEVPLSFEVTRKSN